MPLCVSFQYIDRETNQEIADKKFFELTARAAEYVTDQIADLCSGMELNPPKHLSQQMRKFQDRVIMKVTIDYNRCFDGTEGTEGKG